MLRMPVLSQGIKTVVKKAHNNPLHTKLSAIHPSCASFLFILAFAESTQQALVVQGFHSPDSQSTHD